MIPGVVSPLVATYFTKDVAGTTPDKCEQWRNVFMFVAFVYVTCCTTYVAFGSGRVQSWNQKMETIAEETLFLDVRNSSKRHAADGQIERSRTDVSNSKGKKEDVD